MVDSGFEPYLVQYLEWLGVMNYSAKSVTLKREQIGYFMAWCAERGLRQPQEITLPILERYQKHLFHYRKKDGKPLSTRVQASRATALRMFYKWLVRNRHLLYNPASELILPKLERRLPKHILTPKEVERVLAVPDLKDPMGVRDRAILETLYSTGMRRTELINLQLGDLDTERGTVMIRQGKGKQDRMIPIGERAALWIEKYLYEVRPDYAIDPHNAHVFLTFEGSAISPRNLTHRVRDCVLAAELGKSGSCHLFRHSMATHMLENGVDIRFIQMMLGHRDLNTTQIYTQVSIRKLKEIHTATHPARLRPDATAAQAIVGDDASADVLLAELAAEIDDDADLDD